MLFKKYTFHIIRIVYNSNNNSIIKYKYQHFVLLTSLKNKLLKSTSSFLILFDMIQVRTQKKYFCRILDCTFSYLINL
jgi:hypothetical protein